MLPYVGSLLSIFGSTNQRDLWTISCGRSAAVMKDVFAYSNSPFNPLETIHQLIAAVGRAERIEEIYEEALNGLQDTVAAERAAILLVDADGVMRFKVWRGLSEPYRRAVEGHTPWTITDANPQPVLVADVAREPMADALRVALQAEGIHAIAF